MFTKPDITEIALRFARALDREDYEAAKAMLAANCRYEARTDTLLGPDAIISSYRRNGTTARHLFDSIEYRSEALETGADTACISFFDRLSKGDKTHTYQCRQRLYFAPDGLINVIKHEELPEERERLLEFCAACGVDLSRGTTNQSDSERDSSAPAGLARARNDRNSLAES